MSVRIEPDPRPTCRVVQSRAELADPHVLSDIRDRRSIVDALYDALVRRGPEGRFEPWLARDWSVEPDCRRWRFRFRAGVICHDGGALTAADAAASLRRALDPGLPGELGTGGVLRGYLAGAVIEAPDPVTLTIETPAPLADLLDLLVDVPVVPERALGGLPFRPVGSGPYRLVDAGPGSVALAAFDAHWAGRPPLARLEWRAEQDAGERARRFQRREADWAVDPPRAASKSGPEWLAAPGTLCVIFMFNLLRGPTVDRRVRHALHHALDVDAIVADPQIMAGTARRLAGPLTARHPGGDAAVASFAHDPDRARSLLNEAGFGGGLALTVDLPSRFPDEAVPLARAIASQWARVGVTATLRVHDDRPGYAERVRAKEVGDLCCFDSSPPSAYRVFREKLDDRWKGPWWLGYANPALNDVIDRAAATRDDAEREASFRDAFRIVHEDAPWLFLYAPDTLWLRSPMFAAFVPSVEGRLRFAPKQPGADPPG